MSNRNASVYITLPVSRAVTRNITDHLETRWLKMILESMAHLNLASEYYNIAVLILLLCLVVMLTIRYVIKYRQRIVGQRKNETQQDIA